MKTKKMKLYRETIRRLGDRQMQAVVGAARTARCESLPAGGCSRYCSPSESPCATVDFCPTSPGYTCWPCPY